MPDLPIRTVEVVPPSKSNESISVLLTSGVIVLFALYAIAARTGLGARAAQADNLPFQTLFQDLPGPEQRIVRALREGFTEAKRVRAEQGAWPDPALLARDQIPPFAPDALDREGYRWSMKQERLLVNYLGVPTEGNPLFLLVIVEPDPETGERPGTAPLQDAEHQLLPDGKTLLHVTVWMKAKGPAPEGLVASPALAGWTQIRADPPPEERR